MKKELQEQLFKKYPLLFKQKDLPPTQTCMFWGFDCGDGWYDIIDRLCEFISKDPSVEATQIKEKFGGLRFYISGGNSSVYKAIHKAEEESYKTCELCGSKEKVSQNKKGWIRTLCTKCRNNDANT